MSILVCTLQGRFGNQAMQWLFAYAFAQKHGLEFRCDEWIGERIFALPTYSRPDGRPVKRYNEIEFAAMNAAGTFAVQNSIREPHDVEFRGYAQQQACMIYSKHDAQAWLKLRPEIETACANAVMTDCDGVEDHIVCHRRVGDYKGYGYPIVSHQSYKRACERFGLDWYSRHLSILTEEDPTPHAGFLPDDLMFMPDFYRLMVAPTLLRGNSSFSWLAALLGDGLVLSPIIDGLEGGKEHDCVFVAGNHPKFANLDFVTDLRINP